MILAEGIGRLLKMGTQYVADCEGDVPLRACLPYISGSATLEEGVLAPVGLKDSGMVVTDQVEELVHELWGPPLDGQCDFESLGVADEGVVPEYPRGEGSVIGSASHEGPVAGHASIDVELYWVAVILVNDECAVCGWEEPIKPG